MGRKHTHTMSGRSSPLYCTLILVAMQLFLTFSVLVANPKKLLYTVANPARGLLNREKVTVKMGLVIPISHGNLRITNYHGKYRGILPWQFYREEP